MVPKLPWNAFLSQNRPNWCPSSVRFFCPDDVILVNWLLECHLIFYLEGLINRNKDLTGLRGLMVKALVFGTSPCYFSI
jgi:hypothetical protein